MSELYTDAVKFKGNSLLRGEEEYFVSMASMLKDEHLPPVVKAFLVDESLIVMCLGSSDIGFTKSYTKVGR